MLKLLSVDRAGKFDLRIVDNQFEGKRPVPRQQAVYAPLNAYIASGAGTCGNYSCND